jgi:YesN/AraC family two-component response regulator
VIVDDEYEIRNGLGNYVPWEELGFVVAGLFGNGRDALDFLKNQVVDVLMTDIRMPVVDGMELIRQAKALHPAITCVVLSGHRDFEYARSAMTLGVRHYIVKPTKYQQLASIFTQIAQELQDSEGAANRSHNAPSPVSGSSGKQEMVDPNQQAIRSIKQFINEHLGSASLEEVASHVRLNPNYLSTYFHQHTGQPFGEYLIKTRMAMAAELLKKSSKRIGEIADFVGYSSANSFSRTFRHQYGISPKDYRRLYGMNT